MLRMLTAGALSLAFVLSSAVPAFADALPIGTADSDYGTILVDGDGMTLYAFADGLNCTGTCLENWPALLAEAESDATGGTGVTGEVATAERADGTLQVTYNGIPLYYYFEDAAAGDTNGQGVGGRWYVVPVGATSYAEAESMSTEAGAEAMADEETAAEETTAETTTEAPATLPKTGAPALPLPLVLMLFGMLAAGVGFGYMAVVRS